MSATPGDLANGEPSQAPRGRAQLAYDVLRERLLEGPLGAGESLSVVDLAAELGCSRVPVMEALKRLQGEGFVTIVPQVGCHVVNPAADEVRDFFALFAAVEGTVTAFAAERRTGAEVTAFEALYADIERTAAVAAPPGRPDPTYRRLNARFHSAIHAMARSPMTTTLARGLWDRSDFYIRLAFGSLYFSARVSAAHRAIRDAIGAGDPAAAREAVTTHLLAVGDSVARTLAARNAPPP
ncbi:MAG: GntR family transcriptional regulator [Gammaproteobacteria bacterium]